MAPTSEFFPSLQQIPADYDSLFSASATLSPFLTREWFAVLAEYGLEEKAAAAAIGIRNAAGRPVLLAPLTHKGPECRVIERLANYYTLHYQPLIYQGLANEELIACIHKLVTAAFRTWPRADTLLMHPLGAGLPATEALEQAPRCDIASRAVRYRTDKNWYLDTAGLGPAAYEASLPSVLQNTLRRRGAALNEGMEAEYRLCKGQQDLSAAIDDYQSVYKKSWKAAEPDHRGVAGCCLHNNACVQKRAHECAYRHLFVDHSGQDITGLSGYKASDLYAFARVKRRWTELLTHCGSFSARP